jgi:hypothetical protein
MKNRLPIPNSKMGSYVLQLGLSSFTYPMSGDISLHHLFGSWAAVKGHGKEAEVCGKSKWGIFFS